MANLSRNGRWLAYVSDKSNPPEVYVRPVRGQGGEQVISTGGGTSPVWGPDDTEIFYRGPDRGVLMRASLQTQPGLSVLSRTELFDPTSFWWLGNRSQYDIRPDGKRFLMLNQPLADNDRPRINVVVNFDEVLKHLAPTD